MLAQLKSAVVIGLECYEITVEVDITRGMPSFTIVGLGDTAIQESRERIRSAIKNAGFTFPPYRITVNLAPADLKKYGPSFDLPIALGILISSGQLLMKDEYKDALMIGELALDGMIRRVQGVLPISIYTKERDVPYLVVPKDNTIEATIIPGIRVIGIETLRECIEILQGSKEFTPTEERPFAPLRKASLTDIDHIRGQDHAKRALMIAAAGGHNLLMTGPPGSGKTMLAKAFQSILPDMTLDEAIEITKLYSISGMIDPLSPLVSERPFRSVHHTASDISIIGGGRTPKPGEISLAHRGVLFLDEIAEFPQHVLEVLRQPLEDRVVTISRAQGSLTFPADFTLVAAMNPCPCGYYGDQVKPCSCSPHTILRYQKRLSGPLMDRIDLHITIPRITYDEYHVGSPLLSGDAIREKVSRAREVQQARFVHSKVKTNHEMTSKDTEVFCELRSSECTDLLSKAVEMFQLSGRAYYRILKTARTIADLDESDNIQPQHLAEALQYRKKETTMFA